MPSFVIHPSTGKLVEKEKYYHDKFWEKAHAISSLPMPYVRSDLPPYVSPVTGKVIEGRAARREDLARTGCREVDPSEGPKDGYTNYEFCQRRRLPYRKGDIPPPMTRDEKEWAKERSAKAKAAEKAADALRAKAAEEKIDPDLAKFTRGNTKTAPIFKNGTVKE